MTETLGAMLTRLRQRKGYSQLDVATKLCELSDQPTVTRHEVSRWERQERHPSRFWLPWLANVLDVPLTELQEARGKTAPAKRSFGVTGQPEAANPAQPEPAAETATAPPRQPATTAGPAATSHTQLTLGFTHRATNVELRGTYELPEQATAAVSMFLRMILATGHQPPPATTPGKPSPAAAALTTAPPPRVPMGIRYTTTPVDEAAGQGVDRRSSGTAGQTTSAPGGPTR